LKKKRGNLNDNEEDYLGPGMDLVSSLAGIILIACVVIALLYKNSLNENDEKNNIIKQLTKLVSQYDIDQEGKFKLSSNIFEAGDFKVNPVSELTNHQLTIKKILKIIEEYNRIKDTFPYIFIIGHANQIDDPYAIDRSPISRSRRNYEYASKRAAVIASLLQSYLNDIDKNKIVTVSTGELDMANPDFPYSQKNAFVEIVFGKEWKPPSRITYSSNN
jgi:hypothetical protein